MNPIDEKLRDVLRDFNDNCVRSAFRAKFGGNLSYFEDVDQALLALKQVFLEMVDSIKCDDKFSGHWKSGYNAAKAKLRQKVKGE